MSKDMKNDLNEINDTQILKDMLESQRIELAQKDQELKTLEATINELVSELKYYKTLEENQDANQKNNTALKAMQRYVVELENKVYQLNKQITKLEQEKSAFIQKSEKLTSEQEYTSTLENKIVEYDEKIDSLEKANKQHRETIDNLKAEHFSMVTNLENKIKEQNDYVASLVKENRELLKVSEKVKIEPFGGDNEGNVVRLQKEIALLQGENKELVEKNRILKAALLLHVDTETTEVTDTKIHSEMLIQKESPSKISREATKGKEVQISDISTRKVQEQVSHRHESIKESENFDTKQSEQVADIPKGMVQELVKKRHEAIETREVPNKFLESSLEPPKTTEEPIIEQVSKEQEIPTLTSEKITPKSPPQSAETPDIDDIGVIVTSDGRRKCPICNNDNIRQIREVEDKTKIISAYPRMYGKKFKCGQCGAEWR